MARRATREALVRHAALPFHHFVFNGTLKGIERECKVFVKDPNTRPVPGEYARGIAAQTENAEEREARRQWSTAATECSG